jgi:16S rRNA (cytidine1402-2'-O)-methyltransferase
LSEKGSLFLVATPIGNLEDITLRALKILGEVDLIAAEDTRQTLKLLNHFEIKKPLVSYYEYNKAEKGNWLIAKLLEGQSVALVSDAGTPGISDPGEDLVALAIQNGINVTMAPGPVAAVTGLVLSGLPAGRFVFEGFLPMNKKSRREKIAGLMGETRTIVFYEAPHKLLYTLKELKEAFDPRKIVLARELTKKFEEFVRCNTIAEALEKYELNPPRGEFVLILEGAQEKQQSENQLFWSGMSIEEHMGFYLNRDMDKKAAMKKVAEDRGISKREVYSSLLDTEAAGGTSK